MTSDRSAHVGSVAVLCAVGVGVLLAVTVRMVVPAAGLPAAPVARVAGISVERDDAAEVAARGVPGGVLRVDVGGCGEQRQASATVVRRGSNTLVLTNSHVVRGSSSAVLDMPDGSEQLDVVATVRGRDVALLAIAEPDLVAGIDALETGPSPAVGDRVVVAGYPAGDATALDATVVSIQRRAGYGGTSDVLVIDAAAVGGISGGAVLDASGRVVGLVAARDPGTGFTVAYPIDVALDGAAGPLAAC